MKIKNFQWKKQRWKILEEFKSSSAHTHTHTKSVPDVSPKQRISNTKIWAFSSFYDLFVVVVFFKYCAKLIIT